MTFAASLDIREMLAEACLAFWAAKIMQCMTAPFMYLENLNMPVALDGLCIELFVGATTVLHATRLQSLLLVVLDWDFEVKLSHSTASWCKSSRRCKSQCS